VKKTAGKSAFFCNHRFWKLTAFN